jgi:hypothetical protein
MVMGAENIQELEELEELELEEVEPDMEAEKEEMGVVVDPLV